MSPRRHAGWEPRTFTRTSNVYDDRGLLVESTSITTREPEFDEVDRALLDELQNYREDLHVCGRPLTESLHDAEKAAADQVQYIVATQTCRACQALDRRQADRHKADTALLEAGRHPEAWRLDTVMTTAEAAALLEAGQATVATS